MSDTAAVIVTNPTGVDWAKLRERMRPGAHLAVFTATRDYWPTAQAIEDRGLQVRDSIRWVTHTEARFVLLARNPLDGTVANNTLTHGCGGINIDACRTRVQGEALSVPQSDPTKRSGLVGADLGISGADIGRFQQAQRESIERTLALGRFPTNLVMSHHPACVLTGTRQVKAITGTDSGRGVGKPSNVYGQYAGDPDRVGEPTGYADENGNETIDAWNCHPDCAINRMDNQAGTLKSGVPGIMREGLNNGACYGAESRPPGTPMVGYGDEGGPSRFFPTFPAGTWFAYAWIRDLITPAGTTSLTIGPEPDETAWPEPVHIAAPDPQEEALTLFETA